MRPRRLKNEINVVPYIDVMLVLLVIFMVVTPMMQTGAVDLPTTGKSSQLPDHPIRVEVKESGELTVKGPKGDSRSVGRAELGATLKALKETEADTAILVAGDKNVRYEAILGVLDEIKQLNFTRVGLETVRK
ncbi:MAG TPA: ExbD/TolR family protein [Rhodocyclaceae bacterium]|nr:ExbD/TolR family protein [Rhodocyclaceae bacterium]